MEWWAYCYALAVGVAVIWTVFFKKSAEQIAKEKQEAEAVEIAAKLRASREAAKEAPNQDRIFTKEELKEYGSGALRIYMGCKGTVYDVTESGFYGPNGGYPMLAGRDASLALASMDLVRYFFLLSLLI